MKKAISLVICLILCLSVLPMGASAQVPADLKWTQLSESTAQITYYLGLGTELVIPTTINGLTVTEISSSAFYGTTLEKITLPEKLEYIGDWAFCSSSLKSITIPNTVKEIGDNAFDGCAALKNVSIGNGLLKIEEKTFYKCSALETLTIGTGVQEIEKEAFRLCTSLKTLTIPDNVVKVGEHAFADCTSLKTINIGKGLSQIGEYAFCDTLNLVYYDNPTAAQEDVLWKQNVKADVVIDYANTAAQKHFKSLKKDFTLSNAPATKPGANKTVKHKTVAKNKKPTISATTKKGTVTVKWSKVKTAKKYKLIMGGAKKKTYTVKKTTLTIKNLKVGKKYTFKVRADFAKAKTSKTIKIKVK